MFSLRLGAAIAQLLVLGLLLGCSRREQPRPSPAPVASELERPPAPATLVATFLLPRPQQSYEAARASDRAGRALPWQLPVLLAHRLGLPPLVSGRFSLQHAAVGAIGNREDEWEWVLAFRVQSGAELVAELSTGSNARFMRERKGDLTLLRGAQGSLAVVDSMLGFGSSESALERYALYLARLDLTTFAPFDQADVSVALGPSAGARLGDAVERRGAELVRHAQELLAEQAAVHRGAAEFANGGELSELARALTEGIAGRLRAITGGALQLHVTPSATRLSGQLRVSLPTSSGPRSCLEGLALPGDVGAALLLPEPLFSAAQLERLERALGGSVRPALPGADLRGFWERLAGPVLVAAAAGDNPRWLLAAPVSDGEPGRADLTDWTLGVGAEALAVGSRLTPEQVFPSWARLCPGQPLLALGLRGSSGFELALSRRTEAIHVEGKLPTSRLLPWASASER